MFKPLEAIVTTYNRSTQKRYTVEDFTFSEPTLNATGKPTNSQVTLYPKAHTLETTGITINYNRIHTTELGPLTLKKNGRTKVHEILNELSTSYQYEFLQSDVKNNDLPAADVDDNITVVLEFEPLCYGYYSGTKIHTPETLSVDTVEKTRIDRIAKMSQAYSSFSAAIFNNATWAMTALGKLVRSDLTIPAGKHYWEVTKISRDSLIGFGSRTMEMNRSNGVGSTTNSWALDTATGKLVNSGVAVDFLRPVAERETIGFLLDTNNSTLTVYLSDTSATTPVAVGTTELVVMACGSDDTRSTLKFNLGQDPMTYQIPSGVKHGIYTLLPDGV